MLTKVYLYLKELRGKDRENGGIEKWSSGVMEKWKIGEMENSKMQVRSFEISLLIAFAFLLCCI